MEYCTTLECAFQRRVHLFKALSNCLKNAVHQGHKEMEIRLKGGEIYDTINRVYVSSSSFLLTRATVDIETRRRMNSGYLPDTFEEHCEIIHSLPLCLAAIRTIRILTQPRTNERKTYDEIIPRFLVLLSFFCGICSFYAFLSPHEH